MFDVQINDRGQITIPKELRDKFNITPHETLNIDFDDEGRLVLSKKDIFDDIEDLIKKDLIREGVSPERISEVLPERKKALAKALLKMSDESADEIEEGNFASLSDLKQELKNEGLI